MASAQIKFAKQNGSIFTDSIKEDFLICAGEPSQTILLGASKKRTEGSTKPSTISIAPVNTVASSSSSLIRSHVKMDDTLGVDNDVKIKQGALLFGSSTPSTTAKLDLNGNVLIQGGDVTLSNGNDVVKLSEGLIGAQDDSNGILRFTRFNGSGFDVQISAAGNVIDDLVDRSPPVGTLMWVMLGQVQEDLNTSYLLADGSEVSQTEYPELFQIFNNAYGEAESSGNFRLPKLTGFSDQRNNLQVNVKETIDEEGTVTSLGETFRIRPLIVAR